MKKDKESEWIIEGLIKKNAINIMKFEHDDWCNKMKSVKKECNCNPDVSVGPLDSVDDL